MEESIVLSPSEMLVSMGSAFRAGDADSVLEFKGASEGVSDGEVVLSDNVGSNALR